jgi:hypothetical protein
MPQTRTDIADDRLIRELLQNWGADLVVPCRREVYRAVAASFAPFRRGGS